MKLSIICGNIQGLYHDYNLTKVNAIYDLACINNASLICLTESHLSEKINDIEITNNGWTVLRTDHTNRLGGGVGNLLKSDFLVSNKLSYSNSYCDILCIYIKSNLYIA